MYTKLKILFLVAFALSICLICTQPLYSVNEDAGTTGFNALKIVYSARASAMGQAMNGIITNTDGMQFNPSSILGLASREVSSTYMNYFIDAQGGSLQLLLPQDKYTSYGFFLNYLNFGDMERTLVNQSGDLVETGESFGSYNIVAGASIAKNINPVVDFGGTLKMIYDKIDDTSASAVMIDFGILHHPENEKVKVGGSVRNLGTQLSYYSDSEYKEKLPVTYSVGLSYKHDEKSLLGIDITKSNGQNFIAKLGVEYFIYPIFALRAGFRTDAGDWRTGGSWEALSGISTGMGLNWNQYKLDYAISSYGDLGFVNQLTLKYTF